MNYDDFADLGQTSFGTGEPAAPKKDPKDELFHNFFIYFSSILSNIVLYVSIISSLILETPLFKNEILID